jgi:hypothetical protein
MLTKDEVERFQTWVESHAWLPGDESWVHYFERGLIECELYELTAKKKWEAEKESWDAWLERAKSTNQPVGVYAIIDLFTTADAAIMEAENARR